MAIYLITHGERTFGPDPIHTNVGISQVGNLTLPPKIALIVSGTGRRFTQILKVVRRKLPGVPVKYSPFCGTADGLEPDGRRILTDGTLVNSPDYLGITKHVFDMWAFIAFLPDSTLLCAGGELMAALDLREITEKGQLYRLDPNTKTGKQTNL